MRLFEQGRTDHNQKYGVAIDTDQSVALHYILTIDTDQVLCKTHV